MSQLMNNALSPHLRRRGSSRGARHKNLRAGSILARCVVCIGLATVLLTPTMAEETVAEEAASIRAVVMNSFSIKELWHSHHASSFFSQHTVFVVYRASNYENEPIDGDWRSPGFVMFGRGDIDEKPVAIRIWTKGEDRFLEDLSRKETQSGKDGVALFGPSEDDVRLRITAKPHAEVLVNGRSVAWIDDFFEGGQTGIEP